MKVKRPLNRSVIIVCAIFIGLLCVISSLVTYFVYTRNMFKRYKKQLNSVVSYVESNIDHDDMAECADTFVESQKYKTFQIFMDNLIDNYEDIHYLYIMKVEDPNLEIPIHEICAANSTYEKENEPDMVMHLGDGDVDWFTYDEAKFYKNILDGKKDYYFKNKTIWGTDYTLARPVKDSNGNYYGLLCADIAIDEINTTIYQSVIIDISLVILAGALFIALLIMWMRKNVVKPIKELENSVTGFANLPHGQRKPEELMFNPPKINTKNEVEALGEAYEKLALEMHNYVLSLVAAEDEAKGLKEHAYHDALTHVKNKAAYEEMREKLLKDIYNENAEFGLVMADINYLKNINDMYGHEKGDEYIKGACKIICDIYAHSNVYRIGGDEFVVLLQNRDYQNRDKLIEEARSEFDKSMFNEEEKPWNRYSAALGMSIWMPGDDFDVVFSRADSKMYAEKSRIKETYKVE